MEVKSDPGKRTRDIPQIYEGKDLGGYERHTLQTGYYKLDVVANNLVPSGIVPGSQFVSELTFSQPPAVIQPGETFELRIQGRNSVKRTELYSGASGRWGGPQGMEDQNRVCSIPIDKGDPRTFSGQCSTSVRFTAGSLPDEFSFIQVAQGQGVVGEFRYCKNRVCPNAAQTGGWTSTPGTGPFRVEISACQGDISETRRGGRLNAWARAINLPGDDERSTFAWTLDGQPTDQKVAAASFDGLSEGEHTVTAVAIYRGQRSQSDTVTCRVIGRNGVGIRPTVTGPGTGGTAPPGHPGTQPPTPPQITTPAPKPAAVTIKTAQGTREIDPLLGNFAIQLAPGDPRAEFAGRCNMLMATFVAVASSVNPNVSQMGTSALSDMLFQIRVICGKKLGLNRTASIPSPNGFRTADADDSTLTGEVTVDLRSGSVRFDTPLEETTLTVRTPAGSIKSVGRASFDASFDPRTLTMAAVSQHGEVEMQLAVPGIGPTRLMPGQTLNVALAGQAGNDGANTSVQQPAARSSLCGLGRVWQDRDPFWKGSWTRRGESNVFDAVWTGGIMRVDAQFVISVEGNRVAMTRTGYNTLSDGEIADYEGTVGSDGATVSGSFRWRNPKLGAGHWQATIGCTNDR